jgi:hypothetical protein
VALLVVTLWRLAIVACSLVGFGLTVAEFTDPWEGLSQQASLLNGVVYLGLAVYPLFARGRNEPRSPWLRGAMAVLLVLVSITFLAILGGDLDEPWSLFEHLLTPLVVVIDWAFVGRNQGDAKWWYPLSWVAFPFAYLVYFLAADIQLYGSLLDPEDSAFAGTVVGFTVAIVVTGYALYGIAKVRGTQEVGVV